MSLDRLTNVELVDHARRALRPMGRDAPEAARAALDLLRERLLGVPARPPSLPSAPAAGPAPADRAARLARALDEVRILTGFRLAPAYERDPFVGYGQVVGLTIKKS